MTTVSIKLSAETERMIRRVTLMGERGALTRAIVEAFAPVSKFAEARAVLHSKQRLRTRTGALSQSIAGTAMLVNGAPAVRVGVFRGPAARYAAVQELGTVGKGGEFPTIKPKRAKALAVPTSEGGALTPAGVARYGGPRDFPEELVFVPFRRGRVVGALYRASEVGENVDLRTVNAVYLLMREVDVKPKYFIRDGVIDALPGMSKTVARVVRGVFSGVS